MPEKEIKIGEHGEYKDVQKTLGNILIYTDDHYIEIYIEKVDKSPYQLFIDLKKRTANMYECGCDQ